MTFVWCFSYLLYFRTTNLFSIRLPVAHSNAIQLMLTLKVDIAPLLKSLRQWFCFLIARRYRFRMAWFIRSFENNSRTRPCRREQEIASTRNLSLSQAIDGESFPICLLLHRLINGYGTSKNEEAIENFCLHLGPYYRYRTYYDWLEMKHGVHVHGLTFMRKRAIFGSIYILTYLLLSTMVSFNVSFARLIFSRNVLLLSFYAGCFGWSILW